MDPATQYNWKFGLKFLSSDNILSALCLFRALAASLAHCFYCNCNAQLFGTAVLESLFNNDSKVVAAPAKHQLANGLVELQWKMMVHMARVYLTEKQMPCNFLFYAIIHMAWMMNAIPVKYKNHLVLPFLLVHGLSWECRIFECRKNG